MTTWKPAPLGTSSGYRGAPLGARNAEALSGRVSLQRVRVNASGYDSDGTYWGLGAPLWRAADEDGNAAWFRAYSRDAAKRELRCAYGAELKFWR